MKRLALLLTLLIPVYTFSQIINIPDDYPTIQEGIDAATNGDTVLVDTGTYVENLNFNGKNVTVGSYYLITMDTSYVSQTIIDGDQNGCVVVFRNFETADAKLIGFTITNGLNDNDWPFSCGGGISVYYASPFLDNLIVYNNSAEYGGGIGCLRGNPTLKNIRVTQNIGGSGIYTNESNVILQDMTVNYNIGGGTRHSHGKLLFENITISDNYGIGMIIHCHDATFKGLTIKNNLGGMTLGGDLVFDSINKCNIYGNTLEYNKDLRCITPVDVILDTFSVLHPTDYYVFRIHNLTIDIENSIIEQVDSDLFVSPNGSNENDGLSEGNPLKTLQYAFSKLRADSLHNNKVTLMEGMYSPSTNQEYYPIDLPDYINLDGVNPYSAIIDAEGQERAITIEDNNMNCISNITLKGGYTDFDGGGIFINRSKAYIDNIIVKENEAKQIGGGINCWGSIVEIKNTIIDNNNSYEWGGGLWSYNTNLTVTNSLISNNSAINREGGGMGISLSNAVLNNVTITNNSANSDGGGIFLGGFHSYGNVVRLTNSVLWNNSHHEIAMEEPMYDDPNNDKLYCLYSNIEGGEQDIIPKKNDTIYWLEGNIDQEPIFVNSGDHHYQINDISPCIDAGTTDTSGLNLPEYDLAGEMRIFNERVDMGAYEWNTFVGIEDASMPEKSHLQVNSYPNPFSTSTTIEYELKHPETVSITFYNSFGRVVDIIEEHQSQGLQKAVWTPENLPEGIYHFRLQAGEQSGTGKIILLK